MGTRSDHVIARAYGVCETVETFVQRSRRHVRVGDKDGWKSHDTRWRQTIFFFTDTVLLVQRLYFIHAAALFHVLRTLAHSVRACVSFAERFAGELRVRRYWYD